MCWDLFVCLSLPMVPALSFCHSACTTIYMIGSSCSSAVMRTGTHQHSDGQDDLKNTTDLYFKIIVNKILWENELNSSWLALGVAYLIMESTIIVS